MSNDAISSSGLRFNISSTFSTTHNNGTLHLSSEMSFHDRPRRELESPQHPHSSRSKLIRSASVKLTAIRRPHGTIPAQVLYPNTGEKKKNEGRATSFGFWTSHHRQPNNQPSWKENHQGKPASKSRIINNNLVYAPSTQPAAVFPSDFPIHHMISESKSAQKDSRLLRTLSIGTLSLLKLHVSKSIEIGIPKTACTNRYACIM